MMSPPTPVSGPTCALGHHRQFGRGISYHGGVDLPRGDRARLLNYGYAETLLRAPTRNLHRVAGRESKCSDAGSPVIVCTNVLLRVPEGTSVRRVNVHRAVVAPASRELRTLPRDDQEVAVGRPALRHKTQGVRCHSSHVADARRLGT